VSSCCRLSVLLLGGGLAARPSAAPAGGCICTAAVRGRGFGQAGQLLPAQVCCCWQLELAAASCVCGDRAAGDAAGAGRCLLRVRRPGCGLCSWSWPLPFARAEVQLRELIAGRAGDVQLLPARRAAAGRRASCSPQRDPGGRMQSRTRRAVSRFQPGGLECSYAGSSRTELEVSSSRQLGVLLPGGDGLAVRSSAFPAGDCKCAVAVRDRGFGQAG
jgi:hypothetical protein